MVATTERNSDSLGPSAYTDDHALRLHQLRTRQLIAAGRRRSDAKSPDGEAQPDEMPSQWKMTRGIEPHAWQQQCVAKWNKKKRGTVKVVTGGGKTLLALMIIESLQNTVDSDLRVVIVVPTIVLMHQWHDAILQHGNLPPGAIARLGGGYSDEFTPRTRILITVLASASQQLSKLVRNVGIGKHLFLIADECHRTGAKEMSQIFKTERQWSLGLSATPEREEDIDAGYNKSLIGKKLGPIIYEFTLADALEAGLVPKFTINHFALPMTPDERAKYEALSRSITDTMSQLRALREMGTDGDFFAWVRSLATHASGELGALATRFVAETSRRRELLNRLSARHDAVIALIKREFAHNPGARIILFHESITEVKRLFIDLDDLNFPVIAEHSELPDSHREEGLELFRKGKAQVIVSARSLIEGFNVPEVDVGIIVASSGSVRQRIQSMGRVLRRHRGASGEEKTSCIHVLYAADSSEENIYGKLNWDETTGVDRNRYFLWNLPADPVPQDGPPQTPLPSETQIDADSLKPGKPYPGDYDGMELSCDNQRNVRNAAGQFAVDMSDLAETIIEVKGSAGKFRVTPKRHFVLVRLPGGEEWETIYVTRLPRALRFTDPNSGKDSKDEAIAWAAGAEPGAPYAFGGLAPLMKELRFKQKTGGVISKRVPGGEAFARVGARASDSEMGADAERLLTAIKALQAAGTKIGRFDVNEALHACFRESGRLYFLCALQKGLEFPEVR
jgi:superfamily II DNA or RNA helicase